MKINKKAILFALSVVIGSAIFFLNLDYHQKRITDLFVDNSIFIYNTTIYSKRMYISIIYGELKNNLNELDKLDYLKAELGFDPSVGFAQIRVSTFYWIEENSTNSLITKSNSREDLLGKITTDSINILYSAEYIKMINNLFIKKYGKNASVKSLGSYYSAGIDYGKDDVDINYSNIVGKTAEEFYYSNMLIEEFPR